MAHLLSIMVVVLGSMRIWENMASPNQNLVFPYYHSVFYPYHQQLLGPYYQPSFGPYYPSGPANWETVSASPASNISKIVGGFQVPSGQIPFMVGFRVKRKVGLFTCAGTLIAPTTILTAGHCFDEGANPEGTKVFINSLKISEIDLPKTAVVGEVAPNGYTRHRLYKEDPGTGVANEYDIALLSLKEPVKNIVPVKVADCIQTAAAEGKTGFVAGWGLTDPINPQLLSPTLQGTVLNVVPNSYCRNKKRIRHTHICAEYTPGGRGVCTGDSGGPLLIGNAQDGYLQIGIFSNRGSINCGEKGEDPGVFIRVARFREWIARILQGSKD